MPEQQRHEILLEQQQDLGLSHWCDHLTHQIWWWPTSQQCLCFTTC